MRKAYGLLAARRDVDLGPTESVPSTNAEAEVAGVVALGSVEMGAELRLFTVSGPGIFDTPRGPDEDRKDCINRGSAWRLG